jgi:hypothetical protein
MPRQIRRRLAQSPESAGSTSAKRNARNFILADNEWSRSKKNAGLVEAAGTAALAIGVLHQVTWRVRSGGGISNPETMKEEI